MQTVNVPAGRLGVPDDDFQRMLDEARRRWHTDQHNRYIAGVTAALTWVAGLRDPLTAKIRPATPDAQLRMRVSAAAIVMNTPTRSSTSPAPSTPNGPPASSAPWPGYSAPTKPPAAHLSPRRCRCRCPGT